MVIRTGIGLLLATAFASSVANCGASAQQVLVTPLVEETGPQTIEDLLGDVAVDEASPEWQETDARLRPRPDQSRSFAMLSALNKITASVSTLAVGVGESTSFGTLTITVRSCQTAATDRGAANAVFVEVQDDPPGQDADDIFGGWMYSAARSVSALEHPVYDMWLVDCVDEVPRPPEDMAREAIFGLPGNPPLPAATPSRRL